jgi:RNA polymerase sigma-70 factor, ECF subfamily
VSQTVGVVRLLLIEMMGELMGPSPPRHVRVREAWKSDRPYLLAVAAGMLRRASGAEDIVQEAFARLSSASVEDIDDLRGWLVVVVRRICLDRLASADARLTTATAVPLETSQPSTDPSDRLTLDDEVRQALAIVVERLSPGERTSFILHDIFGFPFEAIAKLVGRTPAACRQLARRARLSIRSGSFDAESSETARVQEMSELTERFIAACEGGDVRELVNLLDPDVVGHAMVIGLPPQPPVRGADAVAQSFMYRFGPDSGVVLEPFSLEEQPALIACQEGRVVAVLRLDEHEGRARDLEALAWVFSPKPR